MTRRWTASLSSCVADSLKGQISIFYSSTAPYGMVEAPYCADGEHEEGELKP